MQELLRILAKRARWVMAAVIVAVLCSIGLGLMMKPVFESKAIIELNKSSSGASGLDLGGDLSSQVMGDSDSLLTDLQTETAILQSDALAIDVIERLHLASEPPYATVAAVKKDGKGPVLSSAAETRAHLLGVFKGHLKVQPMRGTRLIAVSFDDHDPTRAALLANALIESYKSQYLQSHYSATSEASAWLTKQLEDLKRNVEESEKKLTDFEKETGILTFDMVASSPDKGDGGGSGEAHSVVIQKLDALNSELTQAEANRIQKETIYRFAKSGNAETILAIGNDPLTASSNSAVLTQSGGLSALAALRQQQGTLKVALADASGKYGANNRHLQDLQAQAQEVDRQISEEIGKVANRAAVDFQLAKQTEDSVRHRFQQQQDEANKLNGKAVELAVLSQEASSRKRLYEDLYTKLQEANISAGIKATNITVVDSAWAQPNPVRPNLRTNMLFGLFFGLIFGVVMAFTVESLDRSITTPNEVEEITGRSVVGTIPLFDEAEKSAPNRLFRSKDMQLTPPAGNPNIAWMLSRPKSAVAEACRSLRTSVMLSRAGGGPKVVLVASSVPGEGKTTITVNLAIAFAQHNKRVLVIEADMRRPTLKRVLGLHSETGLSNVLTGTADFDSAVVQGVAVPTLDMLLSGPTPPLPSEILDSTAFDDLLERMKSQYDFILIDSPPATMVTDAIPLGLKSDGIIWLTRAGVVTKPLVTRASEMISKFRLPLIGFVMNGVDIHSVDYQYSYYGYTGSNGYYDQKS